MSIIPPFVSAYGTWPALPPSSDTDDLLNYARNFSKATQDRCADLAKRINDVGAIYGSGAINNVLVNGANPDMPLGDDNFYIAVSGPTAAFSVTGIIASPLSLLGQLVAIHNATGFPMTIKTDAGTIATNGFECPGDVDLVVAAHGAVIARYSSGIKLWVILASVPASGGGGGGVFSGVVVKNVLTSSSTAIVNTNVETDFSKTFTIPASDLSVLGIALRWSIAGTYSRALASNIRIKMKLDSAIFADFQLLTAAQTNYGWSAQGIVIVTVAGAAGFGIPGFSVGTLSDVNTARSNANTAAPAFGIDWTIAHTLKATAQWTNADPGNSIQIDSWTVEYLNPPGTPLVSTLTLQTAEKDFGTTARRSGHFQLAGAGLTAGKPVLVRQAAGPYTGKGTRADEAEMDSLSVAGKVLNATTIDAYWEARHKVRGNFKFDYAVSS